MSWLSRLSLANRKLAALLTLIVIALAVYAVPSLKQQLLPDLSFPAITVTATYQGASPDVVEDQVAKPIEDAVKSVDSVESMTSTSRTGSATVLLQFDFGVDTDTKASEVQQALDKGTVNLPDGVDPQVVTGGTGDQPTITLAATSDADQQQLADDLSDKVEPELKAVDGVNQVTVSGETDQVVTVTPDSDKLQDAGLTVSSIRTALTSNGGTSAGGSVDSDGKSLSIEVGGSLTSVRQVENLWLSASSGSSSSTTSGSGSPSGAGASSGLGAGATGSTGTTSTGSGSQDPVQLKDVASVKVQDSEATTLTRTNGEASLGISVTMDHDGSSVSISDDVRAKIPDLEKSLGDNARLTVISDNGPQVSESVNGLVEEGALGLLMAILIIVLFLRSVRSTLVTAVSIPLSLLIALIALWYEDYSLNVLTLGALTMAVGRVVDDSIVVLENIKRHLGYGEEKRAAILTGVREVSAAVTSSTLTTVAVFLPIGLVSGIVGELFAPFSVTVTVAMLASLVVSLTIVPVLAYWFLKPPKEAVGKDPQQFRVLVEEEERNGRLQRVYVPVIEWATRRRKTVLGLAAVLLVLTFSMVSGLKTSFLGDSGSDSLSVTQTMPAGTSLNGTDTAAKKVEEVLSAVDGVDSYQVTIGSSGGFIATSSVSDSANYSIALTDGADSSAVEDTLRDKFDKLNGAGDLTFSSNTGFGTSSDVEVTLKGDDTAALSTATDSVEKELKKVDEVTAVTSDLSQEAPQITVRAKGEAAAEHGLTETGIASSVAEAVQGSTVTRITVDGTQRDVVIRTTSDAPNSVSELRALKISTSSGDVRLDSVATVTQTEEPVERSRVDGTESVTVSVTPVGDNTGAASTAVENAVKKADLPSGVSYEMGGVTSSQNDAFGQLALAIVAAIAIVFLVLVAVFRSIRQTLILLVSIPFAATGAIALLRVTDTPLGVAALIGLLMLIGIVVTNAIVLMDLINQYRARGMSVPEAVREGGSRRLRPILMTALATIFALAPMALGITGSGGFISQPLAVVVIGGLLSSTVLTLVLIPTLYTMVETRRERRAGRKTERKHAATAETEETVLQPQA
ncbi:efflux RND transporter permease subunit [Streptomyces adelaidensis]|uniref:efflux RND transporter permease subunit n=1 Tax=Streptomyces adelaidensis TaxID=2796465 RepID=UPI00190621F2|nr:efflux RND transporter permease subunit [Streptomyces adelaidensis]